ncbi:MAG TPA: TIM barrel protein [Vicinamibacterales bacterium]|nr:TIM barrel protein [Vicinamibacterales bacterium]
MIRVANAPCSWGVLEFGSESKSAPYGQVLDEIHQTGYVGTELGDWAFMPTNPVALAQAVGARQLTLIGGFVPVALADAAAHPAGVETALRTARLLRDAAGEDALIVLSDDNASVPAREQHAGRISEAHCLTDDQWHTFAAGADRVARAVKAQTGLRTVFHPHCGGYVETEAEIDQLMARTDPSLVGLCLDTGHTLYGGGDPLAVLERHAARVWHVHFKDCHAGIAAESRGLGRGYLAAVRARVFCELGQGAVDFGSVLDALRRVHYDGWIVVEQDVFPGHGAPAESAQRNREYLRALGV